MYKTKIKGTKLIGTTKEINKKNENKRYYLN